MNELLFEQRESELPEVVIFDKAYQVNLKRNELITDDPESYPSLNLGDFNVVMEDDWHLEGFYDCHTKQLVEHPEQLHGLPDHIYLINIPVHRDMDPEGHDRLHDDRTPFMAHATQQAQLIHHAVIAPREAALDLLDHLKGKPEINNVGRQQEKEIEKRITYQKQVETGDIRKKRKRGKRL